MLIKTNRLLYDIQQMKRFRLVHFDFDARLDTLTPIDESWSEEYKNTHRENGARLVNVLKEEYV